MAMRAGLVALAPDIDLQRLELPPPQSQAVFGQSSFKTIHVSEGENAGIAELFRKCGRQLHWIQGMLQEQALPIVPTIANFDS